MAAVWAAGPEPIMATFTCGGVEGVGAMVEVEEEKGRRGAKDGAAGPEDVVAFWYVREAAAKEIEDRWVVKRRKFEPNSLTVGSVTAMGLYVRQKRRSRYEALRMRR